MKRYERAKNEGLNWQSVLVQDLETDIKILMLNEARNGVPFNVANQKAMYLINKTLSKLESDAVRQMAYSSLVRYSSRVYVQASAIYFSLAQQLQLASMLMLAGLNAHSSTLSNILSTNTQKARIGQIPASNGYNRSVPNAINPNEYDNLVIKETNKILDSVAKVDYSEYTSIRASVEMRIREEWHKDQLAKIKDSGENFVWIDSHANCSERCQPWQGRLYSLDGTTGMLDGIDYVPLEKATDVYYTTKAGRTYKNGCLSGFGCRHKTVLYRKGVKPQVIPESVTQKQYAIDKRMRELEREVRKYEARALFYKQTNKVMYKASILRRNEWLSKYQNFAKKNNVAVYPSRLDV